MENVSIKGNDVEQREIVKRLANILGDRVLVENDYDMLKQSVRKLAELECGEYRIKLEFSENDETLYNSNGDGEFGEPTDDEITLGFSSEAEDITKDASIWINTEYFFQKFFKSGSKERRIVGLRDMLLSIYHEVEHAKQRTFINRSRLRPEVLEFAYEMVVKSAADEDFYSYNYDRLTSEMYADIWGRFNMSELLDGNVSEDIIQKIREANILSDAISFTNAKVGKVYEKGKMETRDTFFRMMSDLYIKKYPKTLYNYPVLQKIYSENGKRKDLQQMLEQMIADGRGIVHRYSSLDRKVGNIILFQQEYKNCTEFYYEATAPLIAQANEEEYKKVASRLGVSGLQAYLRGMEQYFNEKAESKMKYIELARKMKMPQALFEDEAQVEEEQKYQINAIVRFENGCTLNKISDKLLREGGHIRGTREILTNEVKNRRILFANSLINIYDAFESENDYENRAFNEKADIDEVIDALYFNRFEGFMKNKTVEEGKKNEFGNEEVAKIAQILKAAKILTCDSKKDYFTEFLLIPDVNSLLVLLEMDKSGYLKQCIAKGRNNKSYPETEAEQGKYKEYIRGLKDNSDKIQLLNEELPKVSQRTRGSRCR